MITYTPDWEKIFIINSALEVMIKVLIVIVLFKLACVKSFIEVTINNKE